MPGKIRFQLNNGQTSAVKSRHGLGGDTAVPRKPSRKNKRSTRAKQEGYES